MRLYAWIAPDASGHVGPMSIATPFGVSAAVFTSERLAQRFADQAQMRADELGVNVELTTFETETVLHTITPRTRSN